MRNVIQAMCSIFVAVFVGGSQVVAAVNSETELAAQKLGALKVSELQHEAGKSALSQSELTEVKEIVQDAKANGRIKEIKIISWGDREYPPEGQKASKGDIKLAENRAEALKKYVKDDLGIATIRTYNMAKRPNAVQELFETTQARVKGSLESTGAAPTADSETGFMGFKGKASESLVLVYVE